MKKVFQVKNNSIIDFDYVSKIKYRWIFKNQLYIMQDQKTIIGVEYNYENDHSILVLEDIMNQDINSSFIKFGDHSKEITTILVDHEENYILSAGDDKKVVQYALNANNDCIKMVKDYGNLDIGLIKSSLRIGNIAIFGGNDQEVRVVFINKKQVWNKPIKLKSDIINSLEICRLNGSDSKIILALNGLNYTNPKLNTDYLDIKKFLDMSLKVDQF